MKLTRYKDGEITRVDLKDWYLPKLEDLIKSSALQDEFQRLVLAATQEVLECAMDDGVLAYLDEETVGKINISVPLDGEEYENIGPQFSATLDDLINGHFSPTNDSRKAWAAHLRKLADDLDRAN